MESEKLRYASQMEDLGEKIAAREKDVAKLDDKCKGMSEERATLLSKQKELHWEKDQESKRMTKEISRLSERAEHERSDHL